MNRDWSKRPEGATANDEVPKVPKGYICPVCDGHGFVPETPAFLGTVRYERVKRCQCDNQITRGALPRIEDKIIADFFIRDISARSDMVAMWEKMATATHNSNGYPLREDQRKFAQGIIRAIEDWTGTAV